MKKIVLILSFFAINILFSKTDACTNYLVTKGASTDGSTMISYAADWHLLYGELYHFPAATWPEGTMMDVYEWGIGKHLGQIKQASETYNVVGNMNQFQLVIGETTFTGRQELSTQTGAIMDYGSLIYVTLQRAKNAREAIKTIAWLMDEYGYYSSGESFSIADKEEVWIMELIGKGEGHKGAVWVARKIPDGYVSGHANQARITTFEYQNENKWLEPDATTFNAKDVISFAREKGWFEGKDADFSFSDTYNPINFRSARGCEMRVWTMFNKVKNGMEEYWDYVTGHIEHEEYFKDGRKNTNGYATNRMPLWIKPDEKISVRDMMTFMRDHYEDTELDMNKGVGAGPFGLPHRWGRIIWEIDSVSYCHERPVAVMQTAFSFVSQSRSWMPDDIGGILWFGMDDASNTVYMPMYSSITSVPPAYEKGNGSIMEWSDNSAHWIFNQLSTLSYLNYNTFHPEIEIVQREFEDEFLKVLPAIDASAMEIYKNDKNAAIMFLTQYSANQGTRVANAWKKLYQHLFMKYADGVIRIKKEPENNEKHIEYQLKGIAAEDDWLRAIAREGGDKHKVVSDEKH